MNGILVKCLMRLLTKDQETYLHSLRVGSIAKVMAGYLNFSDEEKEKIVIGCLLHDYGKILIPDDILKKQSFLSPKELEVMERHPILGLRILLIEGDISEDIINIVKFHHERVDGKGYPYGLKGDEIPAYSRICSIIDAYDSKLSNRGYNNEKPTLEAREEILKHSGTQFDEKFVHQFLSIPEHLLSSYRNMALNSVDLGIKK